MNFRFIPVFFLAFLLINSGGCGNRHQVAIKAATDTPKKDENIEPVDPVLLKPSAATEAAPEKFRVKVETTKGDFVIDVTRAWAPHGADRFYNLVKIGFFNDIAIFRAIDGFMFQFGIHGNPRVSSLWSSATIKDDPPKTGVSNTFGTVSFAKTGAPNSRSSQIFINLADNAELDGMGFRPFGVVTGEIGVISKINTEYGENDAEVQPYMSAQGNKYIKNKFPNVDYIKSMTLVEP